jgi:AbrB family looped-hinge helix DNA binding protein
MANQVGTKGQIVIEKEIRDKLGIQPGWKAYQQVVDGHLEIYFLPPEHRRSLLGILAKYANPDLDNADWHDVREKAWAAAAEDQERLR